MSSKGQSEILGLLAIVILLAVLSLIALRFFLNTSPSLTPDIRQHTETSALLGSMMKVTISGSSLQDLAVACSSDTSRCADLDTVLDEVFSAVLQPQEAALFTLTVEGEEVYEYGSCTKGITVRYPFVRHSLAFEASLLLCPSS